MIIHNTIIFEDTAPSLESIMMAVSEIAGLPVVINNNYRMHSGTSLLWINGISFESEQQSVLSLICWDGEDPQWGEPSATPVKTQTIRLEGYGGQERTLWEITLLALEKLGAITEEEIIPQEDRDYYCRAITEEELRKRHEANNKRNRRDHIITLILLPISIPLTMIMMFSMGVFNLVKSCFKPKKLK